MTRIKKFISERGMCSSREADKLIREGKVTVNGQTAGSGMKVTPDDDIQVNGKTLREKSKAIYLAFYKQAGITCTSDSNKKNNIIDFIKYPDRIFPVGRLDKASEGLVLLTNDGEIVNKILRAEYNHEKEYLVTVDKPIDSEFIFAMSNGVAILNTVTKKCFVEQMGANSFRIVLVQGLNRQIRRMSEVLGYRVIQLKRVRIMNITLDGIEEGKWRYLSTDEMTLFHGAIAGSIKTEIPSA